HPFTEVVAHHPVVAAQAVGEGAQVAPGGGQVVWHVVGHIHPPRAAVDDALPALSLSATGSSAARMRPDPPAVRRPRSRPAPAAEWPGRPLSPHPPRCRFPPAARAAG